MMEDSRAAEFHPIRCLLCQASELESSGDASARCTSCGGSLGTELLGVLREIRALPDALGAHACECSYPEMRRLPDGVFHCPACGSEVLPLEISREPTPEHRSQAYWCGWIDGRFGESGCFTENLNLARYSAPSDRLDYYRGHRAGSEAPLAASNGRLPAGALRGTGETE